MVFFLSAIECDISASSCFAFLIRFKWINFPARSLKALNMQPAVDVHPSVPPWAVSFIFLLQLARNRVAKPCCNNYNYRVERTLESVGRRGDSSRCARKRLQRQMKTNHFFVVFFVVGFFLLNSLLSFWLVVAKRHFQPPIKMYSCRSSFVTVKRSDGAQQVPPRNSNKNFFWKQIWEYRKQSAR